MSELSFYSIAAAVEDEILREKGSRFIGFAYPVQSVQEAEERLTALRSLHPKATHHCYAYRLSPESQQYRANDDGEPSGTAGLPILNQIQSFDVYNVLVVVVRYYGGIKLGVSGLIKAYKESAKLTLSSAVKIEVEPVSYVEVQVPQSQSYKIYELLKVFQGNILSHEMMNMEKFVLSFPKKHQQKISSISEEIPDIQINWKEV